MLGYSFEHEFDSGWGFNQKARYFDVDTHQRSVYATGTGSEVYQLNRFAYTTDEDLQSFNIDNQVTKTVALGDWQHHLLAGFDYQKLNSHFHYRYASTTPGMDMRHYSQISESALGLYTAQKNRLSYQQNGYYLQDQLEFGGLNLLGSLRYDDYRSVTTNYLQNGDKAWYRRIASPNVWARFTPLITGFRRLSAIPKVLRRCRRRARSWRKTSNRPPASRWKVG